MLIEPLDAQRFEIRFIYISEKKPGLEILAQVTTWARTVFLRLEEEEPLRQILRLVLLP